MDGKFEDNSDPGGFSNLPEVNDGRGRVTSNTYGVQEVDDQHGVSELEEDKGVQELEVWERPQELLGQQKYKYRESKNSKRSVYELESCHWI